MKKAFLLSIVYIFLFVSANAQYWVSKKRILKIENPDIASVGKFVWASNDEKNIGKKIFFTSPYWVVRPGRTRCGVKFGYQRIGNDFFLFIDYSLYKPQNPQGQIKSLTFVFSDGTIITPMITESFPSIHEEDTEYYPYTHFIARCLVDTSKISLFHNVGLQSMTIALDSSQQEISITHNKAEYLSLNADYFLDVEARKVNPDLKDETAENPIGTSSESHRKRRRSKESSDEFGKSETQEVGDTYSQIAISDTNRIREKNTQQRRKSEKKEKDEISEDSGLVRISVSDPMEYHRSSIYTMLAERPELKFANEIRTEFYKIPLPNKYNDHNLSIRTFSLMPDEKANEVVDNFMEKENVGRHIVARWFDRNKATGAFDIALLQSRGCYDASYSAMNMAQVSMRGASILADAGEDLIGKTFVVVNDIEYVDKEKRAQGWRTAFTIGAAVLEGVALAGGGNADLFKSVSNLSSSAATVADMISGFKVNITSYLYQLDWNEEVAAQFYKECYFDSTFRSKNKRAEMRDFFIKNGSLFKMKYVGQFSSTSSKTVAKGLYSPSDVIRKVCARALDANFVELSKKYEQFRVNSPILTIDEKFVTSPIGLKEGVLPGSVYEVLEAYRNKQGKTVYKKIGKVKAVGGKIWDNRYMAAEEEAKNSDLSASTFKIISGSHFYPGMLIREIGK